MNRPDEHLRNVIVHSLSLAGVEAAVARTAHESCHQLDVE
jgi:hypothetical protein